MTTLDQDDVWRVHAGSNMVTKAMVLYAFREAVSDLNMELVICGRYEMRHIQTQISLLERLCPLLTGRKL